MAGNRNERAESAEPSSRVEALAARRPATISEKTQLLLQLWMIAALLTLIVKAALS
jgi:hypothetical protein